MGGRVRVKVVKNKVAAPFKNTEFDLMYNEGISIAGDLIDLGVHTGVIDKKGNSYTYGDDRLGVGRENAKQGLRSDKKLLKKVRKDIEKAIEQQDQTAK